MLTVEKSKILDIYYKLRQDINYIALTHHITEEDDYHYQEILSTLEKIKELTNNKENEYVNTSI